MTNGEWQRIFSTGNIFKWKIYCPFLCFASKCKYIYDCMQKVKCQEDDDFKFVLLKIAFV